MKNIEVGNINNNGEMIWTYYNDLYDDFNMTRQSRLYSFGGNEMGQLGYGIDLISSPNAIEIEVLSNMTIESFSSGEGHSICATKKGLAYSWGASACGQLGIDKAMYQDSEGYPIQPIPKLISYFNNIKVSKVACGVSHTLALTMDNLVYSWGGSGCGQLGHYDISMMPKDSDNCPYLPIPKLIQAIATEKMRSIACGKVHSLSIDINGVVYTWGAGANGQLGFDDINSLPLDEDNYPYQPIPKCIKTLKSENIIQGKCGDVHTMVLNDKGEVFSFGGGTYGQLGLGPITELPLDIDNYPFMPIPTKIEGLANKKIVFIANSDAYSMAIDSDGRLYSWGSGMYGKLGIVDYKDMPIDSDNNFYVEEPCQVAALKSMKVLSVSCAERHSLVLVEGGALYSFGMNNYDQLGFSRKESTKLNQSNPFTDIIIKPRLLTSFFIHNISKIDSSGVHNLILVDSPINSAFVLYTFLQKSILTDYLLIYNSKEVFSIKCHKYILISRSKYFYNAIVKNKTDKEMIIKGISNVKCFKTIIEYLYLEDISFISSDKTEEKDLIEYLKYAKLFQLPLFGKKIQSLIQMKFTDYSKALKSVYEKNSHNYTSAFNGLFFLPNGTPMLLLNDDLVTNVIENSIIIPTQSDNNISQSKISIDYLMKINFSKSTESLYEAMINNGLSPDLLTQHNIKLTEMIHDKLSLFNQEAISDIVIKVSNGKFNVNKVILGCSSKFFEALLITNGMKENQTNEIVIDDYTADDFLLILLLFYYDSNITFDLSTNLEILKGLDMLQVNPYLISKIETDLINSLSITTVTSIYKNASLYNYHRLKILCLYYIQENYVQVVESNQFEELEREQMLEIIRFCKSSFT